MTVNQDAQRLIDEAIAAGHLTTVGYINKHWKTPPAGTQWAIHEAKLAQARALLEPPVVTPPAAVFGTALPAPPPLPTTQKMVVANETEFVNAASRGGVIAINGRITLTRETKLAVPTVAIVPANGYRKDALLCSPNQAAGLKVNGTNLWIHDLELGQGTYDGIKLGDGAHASFVDIKGCWIHDVGDQGVLLSNLGASDVWVRQCLIEKVGLTDNPGVSADGHCVYLGGSPSARLYVLSNDLRPRAFGVQCYPGPTDVIVAGNTIRGGLTRGGIAVYGSTTRARFVGNLIVDAPSAAFEVAATVGNSADGNVALRCAMWAAGYKQLPGSNLQTVSAQAAADYRLAEGLWSLLPPELADGSPRVIANAGALAVAA